AGPKMVLDGRAAALWGGGIGWPGFDAVAKSDAGARFIAPRDRDDPGEARIPQTPHGPGRVVSRPERADRVRWLVELRHGPSDAAGRRAYRIARAPPRRGPARRAIAAGTRDDGGQHGGGGAPARPQ